MFTMIQTIQKQQMEFTFNRKQVEYMLCFIWLTLMAHAVMEDLIKNGLKYNSTISTASIHFLTKQRGQDVASGVGGQIKAVTDALAQIKAAIKEAGNAAKEASRISKEASSRSILDNNMVDKVLKSSGVSWQKNTVLRLIFLSGIKMDDSQPIPGCASCSTNNINGTSTLLQLLMSTFICTSSIPNRCCI
jgi:hypothetical protein